MGIQIEDGTGTGQTAGVSPTGNRFNVSSRSDDRIYYISRDNEDAYIINSADTAAAGEYNFYFQNTSKTQKFYVTSVIVGSADLAIFKIASVTGTAAGTNIVPVNMNLTSGSSADATAFGNAAVTGLTEDKLISQISVNADDSKEIFFHDALILGQDDAIAVEYDTGAGGTMHVTMFGFYDVE